MKKKIFLLTFLVLNSFIFFNRAMQNGENSQTGKEGDSIAQVTNIVSK